MVNENKGVLDEIDRKLKEVFHYAAENGILIKAASVSEYTSNMIGDIKVISHTIEYER